jgi:hypothetical protein
MQLKKCRYTRKQRKNNLVYYTVQKNYLQAVLQKGDRRVRTATSLTLLSGIQSKQNSAGGLKYQLHETQIRAYKTNFSISE